MARPQKESKTKSKSLKNKLTEIPLSISPADIAQEFKNVVANQCSTKLDVAFIAAEMLMHMGRGQMAAQLGHNFSNADVPALMADARIIEFPVTPNQKSIVEKLFLGFAESVAHNDPALRKKRWKTDGNSDYPFIAALSFLVGNLAWQNHAPNTRMTRDNVKDAFDNVSAVNCPSPTPTAGGGPFCDWMNL